VETIPVRPPALTLKKFTKMVTDVVKKIRSQVAVRAKQVLRDIYKDLPTELSEVRRTKMDQGVFEESMCHFDLPVGGVDGFEDIIAAVYAHTSQVQ